LLTSCETYACIFNVTDAKQINIGDISDRRALINDLKCFSFQWFLDYVYPDASFPNEHKYFGQVIEIEDKLSAMLSSI
jgi:hypothetical protein